MRLHLKFQKPEMNQRLQGAWVKLLRKNRIPWKNESREDIIFQKFKPKIALELEQILKYSRGSAPIWISGENILQEKIPDCPCGVKRIYEFQVMPQLPPNRRPAD